MLQFSISSSMLKVAPTQRINIYIAKGLLTNATLNDNMNKLQLTSVNMANTNRL